MKDLDKADILDVCCGPRMFYDKDSKDREDVIYMDVRCGVDISYKHASGTVSEWHINPDIVGDFRRIPFEDGRFSLVVFDPPHIARKSSTGIVARKYGILDKEWKADIRKGFEECFRVLKTGGFLNFKWSETEIPLSEVTPLFPQRPMYYNRQGISGAWFMFRKEARKCDICGAAIKDDRRLVPPHLCDGCLEAVAKEISGAICRMQERDRETRALLEGTGKEARQ